MTEIPYIVAQDLARQFNGASPAPQLQLSIDEQSNKVDKLIENLKETAQNPLTSISDLITGYEDGLSHINDLKISETDTIAMKQGYNNIATTIGLSTKLEADAVAEAIEITDDIQFSYDLVSIASEQLNNGSLFLESNDMTLEQLNTYQDILLGQIEYAQNFTQLTGINISIPKEIGEEAAKIKEEKELLKEDNLKSTEGLKQTVNIQGTSTGAKGTGIEADPNLTPSTPSGLGS